MKRKKHTPQQILEKLRAVDVELSQGRTFVEIARQLEVSEQTLHRWRNQYGGMKGPEVPPKRIGAGERAAEEDCGRAGDGHRRLEGSQPKKMVGPQLSPNLGDAAPRRLADQSQTSAKTMATGRLENTTKGA